MSVCLALNLEYPICPHSPYLSTYLIDPQVPLGIKAQSYGVLTHHLFSIGHHLPGWQVLFTKTKKVAHEKNPAINPDPGDVFSI
jgi:hypothetical protein